MRCATIDIIMERADLFGRLRVCGPARFSLALQTLLKLRNARLILDGMQLGFPLGFPECSQAQEFVLVDIAQLSLQEHIRGYAFDRRVETWGIGTMTARVLSLGAQAAGFERRLQRALHATQGTISSRIFTLWVRASASVLLELIELVQVAVIVVGNGIVQS